MTDAERRNLERLLLDLFRNDLSFREALQNVIRPTIQELHDEEANSFVMSIEENDEFADRVVARLIQHHLPMQKVKDEEGKHSIADIDLLAAMLATNRRFIEEFTSENLYSQILSRLLENKEFFQKFASAFVGAFVENMRQVLLTVLANQKPS